ncbi:S1 family peptidase [Rhodococcus marinonascens]|uniref:S1 family peptidase n=1 Tax=Rhodococcus marinonascens TaxID=38311 RepID=UPI0009321FE0|nr:S1 family peptidase [Rhodococcus marinonascens]
MRSSIARRAVVFSSAALLLLGPVNASADPVEPGVSDQSGKLPTELVDALRRDLKLSPDQYLEQSELGQELAEFAKVARIQFPHVFAGAWLDDSGTPIVGLTDGAGKDAARTAAEEAGFRVKDADRSEKSLHAQIETLGGWLDTQPSAVADLVRGVAIDIVNNGLVLRADNIGGLQLPDFMKGARVVQSPATEIPQAPAELAPVGQALPEDALLGGDAYGSFGGGVGLRCSLGFNGTDSSGRAVNITAGHCDPNLAAAGTAGASEAFSLFPGGTGPRLGTFAKTSLDMSDYAILLADENAAHRFENNGVRIPGSAPLGITGTADPIVGAPVCKSGLTTGFTCGIVTSVGQTVDVGGRILANSFSTSMCALQGDSGGTIVTGTQALGISSASNVGEYSFCQIADVVTFILGESPELFATPINTVLAENPGLRVRRT